MEADQEAAGRLSRQPDLRQAEREISVLYLNHLEQVEEQLSRAPYPLPQLVLRRRPPSIFDYAYEDFELVNYRHHPPIKAPVAV